jgi:hypothetical protein
MPQREHQLGDSSVTFVWDGLNRIVRVDGDIGDRTVTVELLNDDNSVRGSYTLGPNQTHERAVPMNERIDVIEESIDAGNGTPRPVTRFRHRTQW